jgi:hypothetical protein
MSFETVSTVNISFEPNNWLRRFPCAICGGSTEKQDFLAMFREPGDSTESIACDECATSTPDEIVRRLRQHADHLERWAASSAARRR